MTEKIHVEKITIYTERLSDSSMLHIEVETSMTGDERFLKSKIHIEDKDLPKFMQPRDPSALAHPENPSELQPFMIERVTNELQRFANTLVAYNSHGRVPEEEYA